MDNIETKYVKEVYNQIAKDFDRTRYRQWKSVKEFINTLPKKSLILDAGCGNGKNMLCDEIQFIGCDISEGLVEICQKKGLNVILANVNRLPFLDEMYDAVISIAVLHHIYKREDLINSLNEIIRVTKKNGKIHFTVWAREQELTDKFIQMDENGNYLVTWKDSDTKIVSQRFYHLFSRQEIDELLIMFKEIQVLDISYECDNWNVTLSKKSEIISA